MRLLLALCAFIVFFPTKTKADETPWLGPTFTSSEGRERVVSFKGTYRSELESRQDVEAMSQGERDALVRDKIEPTLKFLFGPLTNRGLASPQRGVQVQVDWGSASLAQGKISLSYSYSAVWIVDKDVPELFPLPVPLNREGLLTSKWKRCTDSAPEHQTEWFYWYFWDPKRTGCDHQEGEHYQTVTVKLGAETKNETASYPEYERLLQSTGQANRFQFTFGFGYVEDPADPKPDSDWDPGARGYQSFVKYVRSSLGTAFLESKVLQNEYRGSSQATKVIGHRFVGKLRGVDVVVNIVAAAGVDQMEIFAKSFAHDHDGFFGWFGHSRVGSGFDADNFGRLVAAAPDYYSVTPNYQLVYWGGCNSYSYYTLPFFDFKARAASGRDPKGTKGLDIIANGLPSYFSLNADNAAIVLRSLLNWEGKPSYQSIVSEIEAKAQAMGIHVLVAVLGDEDNERN